MLRLEHKLAAVLLILALLLGSCGPTTAPAGPVEPQNTRPLPPSTTPLPPRPTFTSPPTRQAIPPTRTPVPPVTARPTLPPEPTGTPPSPAAGPFALIPAAPGRPAGAIAGMQAAPDGALWLATEQGVGSYRDGAWTLHLERAAKLAGFAAGRVYVSLDGDATMAVWDGSAWTFYGAAEGWSAPQRDGLVFGDEPAVDPLGRVWLATCEDVRSFDGTRWTVHTIAEIGFASDEPDYACIWDVAVDTSGAVWAGECEWWGPGPWGDGARWFDGVSWQGADSPVVGAGSSCVSDVEVDAAGRIWMGVGGHLWRYTPGAGWSELPLPAARPEWGGRWGAVYDLTLGPAGDAWLALEPCGGASCLGEWVRYHIVGDEWALIGGPFWRSDLALAPDSSAWLCAHGAIYHVVDNVSTLAAEIDSQGNPCAVAVDAAGRVWVAVPGTDALYVSSP